MLLSETEKEIINLLQKDFGFAARPFKDLADKLNMTETKLVEKIKELKESGIITRIGPFYNLDKSTGYVSLVAMKVPLDKFKEVTELVNGYQEVAHNYERNNVFNMWFVLATSTFDEAMSVLNDIENKTGLKTYNLPKLKEYSLDLYLEV